MAYVKRNSFLSYDLLGYFTKLGYGFNPASYYQAALASETDPIVRQQYQDALDAYNAQAGYRNQQGSNTGLLLLGLATGNPVLIGAGATGYTSTQQQAAAGGTFTAPGGPGNAYLQQLSAGSVESYVDTRVKIGLLVLIGVVGAGAYFLNKKK